MFTHEKMLSLPPKWDSYLTMQYSKAKSYFSAINWDFGILDFISEIFPLSIFLCLFSSVHTNNSSSKLNFMIAKLEVEMLVTKVFWFSLMCVDICFETIFRKFYDSWHLIFIGIPKTGNAHREGVSAHITLSLCHSKLHLPCNPWKKASLWPHKKLPSPPLWQSQFQAYQWQVLKITENTAWCPKFQSLLIIDGFIPL